jgi:NAD(P)H-dependent FMN reductase
MAALVGISGSLRRRSFNSALLAAATSLVPAGSTIRVESIRGIPLYDGDVEASEGVPASVAALKDAVAACDGLLLVTPEYNNSMPGVMKNAIDWLTRPADDIPRVFHARPVAVVGASPGGFGTILSQNAWLPVLRTLRMTIWTEGRLMVSRAGAVFGDDGTLKDAKVRDQLEAFVHGFAAFCDAQRGTRTRGP